MLQRVHTGSPARYAGPAHITPDRGLRWSRDSGPAAPMVTANMVQWHLTAAAPGGAATRVPRCLVVHAGRAAGAGLGQATCAQLHGSACGPGSPLLAVPDRAPLAPARAGAPLLCLRRCSRGSQSGTAALPLTAAAPWSICAVDSADDDKQALHLAKGQRNASFRDSSQIGLPVFQTSRPGAGMRDSLRNECE